MWAHYKKTFVGVQVVIWLVAIGVYLLFGRQWQQAATFFLFMQLSAVIGSVWAARLNAFMQKRSASLIRAHHRL